MGYSANYLTTDPKRAEIETLPGATVLEFGNEWCGFCRRAEPIIRGVLCRSSWQFVRHIKIADAGGKRLGRSYRVKLWPTLIFLKDGIENNRLVRPTAAHDVEVALSAIRS